MKHVTLLADGEGTYCEGDGGWRIEVDGHVFFLAGRHIVSVEDVPEPPPTEPGTVIEATVEGRRNRLALVEQLTRLEWYALMDDGDLSGRWFKPADITDWKLLLPGETP